MSINEYYIMQIGNLLKIHLQKSSEYSCNKFTAEPFILPSIDHSVAGEVLDQADDRR